MTVTNLGICSRLWVHSVAFSGDLGRKALARAGLWTFLIQHGSSRSLLFEHYSQGWISVVFWHIFVDRDDISQL